MVIINPVKSMFWGVTIDAGKRYSQVVSQAFHLSMAALEPNTAAGNSHVQVMIQHGSSEFLVCTLQQGKTLQQPLDLIFASGEELAFSLVGQGTVHLTGYLLEDQMEDEDDFTSDEDESDAPQLVEMDEDLLRAGSKRKALESSSQLKKKKLMDSFDDDDDDDDEDEDDDFDVDDDDDDDEDEEFSEDDLTFDEDEDSDLGEDDEEDEVSDDEEKSPSPKKMAGTPKQTAVTPKGDNAGSAKKDKQGKTPKTPVSNDNKANGQKKQEPKTPETPSTPANGESSKKKKKKKKKNKEGDASMNASTASSPEKSSSESTPKSASKGKKEGNTPKIETPGKRKVVAGGTVVEDLKVGHGPEAKPGKMVSVYYVGTLTKSNKRFDSCTGGKPFRFRLKQGEVIKGWDNGVEGMKVGGKRKITVPANQGYGAQKQGPIPPNSSLTFEVELKAVS